MLKEIKYTLYSQSLEAATIKLMNADDTTEEFLEAAEYILNKLAEAKKLIAEGRAGELSFKID